MVHRGPDDMGTWHDEGGPVGLGHRRLSIIDLSPAGHQPMTNEDGTVWISYNGEIYDFQEHRARLLAKGHQFRSQSDTEVLVHLYEELGPDFVRELNGIFAIALWDTRKRQLLLARDHAGIKPLYYWQDGPRLYFASEIKALLRIPGIPRELNENAVPEYLTLLWVPGEETMLKAVRKIEPGHYLIWRNGRIESKQWFFLDYTPDESVSESEWIDRVHDTFMRTTRRQMVSDVPLGAFLSGGTDSSSIVACMRQSFPDRDLTCYTYTFDAADMARDQFEYDYPYAEEVARLLKVQLKSFHLRPDVISILPKLIYHMDEPDADQSIFPAYLISKLAREDGTTVLLSGTGGDEVLFGYRSHQALRRMEKLGWAPRWLLAPVLAAATGITTPIMGAQSALPRRLRKFRTALLGNGVERFLALSDWSSPSVLGRIYATDFASRLDGGHDTPPSLQKYYDNFLGTGELNRRTHILIQTFLAAHNFNYTDKTSMATSVETRVPFLDVELMRLSAIIPERYKLKGQITKYLLKEAMCRYLPRRVLYRSKSGFGAPLRKWVAEDLRDCLHEQLGPQRLGRRGLFDGAAVQRILRENEENKADHAYLIYALLTLELWMQTFLDRAGEPVSL
jgi:asparagine synthase (glutamine-hydrolysing)